MLSTSTLRDRLAEGLVIPAHPLALGPDRTLDERRQRALSRYYLAAGAGGLAVGVHTTQFAIHEPDVGLYEPVLRISKETVDERTDRSNPPVLVAGLIGSTERARREARIARDVGYDCGLLSLAALPDASIDELVTHVASVAEVLPIFGFYLQPDVGGRPLSYRFWRAVAEVDRLVAVKIAPFDRYRTLDVVRGIAEAGRADEISLYTGNDDQIVIDLLTDFPFGGAQIVGGLLGQWAVWTRTAVELLEEIKEIRRSGTPIPPRLMRHHAELTDANAALFDPAHDYAGCIPGIHEALRRTGLLESRRTLDPGEELSPGQADEIERIHRAYPHLSDRAFVAEHLDDWLR